MVRYKGICAMGDFLRKKNYKHLTLSQLTAILMSCSNSQTPKTLQYYMEILKREGYIKPVTIDGVMVWEVLYGTAVEKTIG